MGLRAFLRSGLYPWWGGETVHINERFYIGGDSLRGFADSGIGPAISLQVTRSAAISSGADRRRSIFRPACRMILA